MKDADDFYSFFCDYVKNLIAVKAFDKHHSDIFHFCILKFPNASDKRILGDNFDRVFDGDQKMDGNVEVVFADINETFFNTRSACGFFLISKLIF